jgi:VWFA-related protein
VKPSQGFTPFQGGINKTLTSGGTVSGAVSDSQESESSVYTLHVYQDLVVVDVVVTDKNGNPIKNLKRENFAIYEDNEPQKITTFDYEDLSTFAGEAHETARTVAPTPVINPSQNPPAQLARDLFQHRRLIILFLDLSSMPVEDLIQAQRAAHNFLEKQMTPADLVAVVVNASSLRVVQTFTNDREALEHVVGEIHLGDSASLAEPGTTDTSTEDLSAPFTADETQFNIFNTDRKLSAIEAVGKMFRDLPQKKFLVHFSSGISTTEVENQSQLRATIDALNQSNTSLYAVDARGLIAAPPGGDATKGSASGTANYNGGAIRDQIASIANSQETLTSLALDTGGKALLDTNDFGQVFQAVQKDSDSYYTLGYNSSNSKRDGHYRHIKVAVNVPGARLKYRPGYYAPKSFNQFSRSDKERQLEEAVGTERPFSEIPFLVATYYLRADDRQVFVPVSLKFTAADIPFEQKGKKAQADFDFIGQVRNSKSVVSAVRDTIRVNLDSESFSKVTAGDIQYQTGFYLKPGNYELKCLLRENQTGKLSTFEQALPVPDFGERKLSISSVILSNRLEPANQKNNAVKKLAGTGDLRPQQSEFRDPLVVEQDRIVPNVARVFSPKDTLYIFFQIYPHLAKKGLPNLAASLNFLRDGRSFRQAGNLQLTQFDEGSRDTMTCHFEVPLSSFPQGDYALQINLANQDSPDRLSQTIHFVVR